MSATSAPATRPERLEPGPLGRLWLSSEGVWIEPAFAPGRALRLAVFTEPNRDLDTAARWWADNGREKAETALRAYLEAFGAPPPPVGEG